MVPIAKVLKVEVAVDPMAILSAVPKAKVAVDPMAILSVVPKAKVAVDPMAILSAVPKVAVDQMAILSAVPKVVESPMAILSSVVPKVGSCAGSAVICWSVGASFLSFYNFTPRIIVASRRMLYRGVNETLEAVICEQPTRCHDVSSVILSKNGICPFTRPGILQRGFQAKVSCQPH
jgi:hypothetical protein